MSKLEEIYNEINSVVGVTDQELQEELINKFEKLCESQQKLIEVNEGGNKLISHGSSESKAMTNILRENLKKTAAVLTQLKETLSKPLSVKVENPQKYPESIKIGNLNDIQFPKQVDEFEIKESTWLSKLFNNIVTATYEMRSALEDTLKRILRVEVVNNKTPEKAIAVRLVDATGRKYINPNPTVVAGGGGGVLSFSDSNDVGKRALLDNQRHVQVDIKNKLVPEHYDAIVMTYPTSTTTVYTYKDGGLTGTTVGAVTLTYTDDTKTNLSSVART